MLIDYKFVRIVRHWDGNGKAVVQFYEGDITTEDEDSLNDAQQWVRVPVTRYRRTKQLHRIEVPLLGRTDDELRQHLDDRLARSRTHTPILEQRNA